MNQIALQEYYRNAHLFSLDKEASFQFEKRVFYPTINDRTGEKYLFVLNNKTQDELVKVASDLVYPPRVQKYIQEVTPESGITKLVINAMGSSNYYGSNSRGDYFPEEALSHDGNDYGHRTFEIYAYPYKHHINYGPEYSYGQGVKMADWNPHMKRVILIVFIDNNKAPDIAQVVDDGGFPEVSMGCRVPFDLCSIPWCARKARTVSEHCEHGEHPLLNTVLPSGHLCSLISLFPKFHDISFVMRGAERGSSVMKKIASEMTRTPSGIYYNIPNQIRKKASAFEKTSAAEKLADIFKEVDMPVTEIDTLDGSPSPIRDMLQAAIDRKSKELSIPRNILNKIAEVGDLSRILSSFTALGMYPKPHEFQRIVLIISNKRDDADILDSQNRVFDESCGEQSLAEQPDIEDQIDITKEAVDASVVNLLAPFIPERSCFPVHLVKRLYGVLKIAQEDLPGKNLIGPKSDLGVTDFLPAFGVLSALYALGKIKSMPRFIKNIVGSEGLSAEDIKKIPILAAVGMTVSGLGKGLMSVGTDPVVVNNRMIYEDEIGPFQNGGNAELIKSASIDKEAKVWNRIAFGAAAIPATYLYSGHQKLKKEMARQQGQEYDPGFIDSIVEKNPGLSSLTIGLGGPHLWKKYGSRLFKKASEDPESEILQIYLQKVHDSDKFSFAKIGSDAFDSFAKTETGKIFCVKKIIEKIFSIS